MTPRDEHRAPSRDFLGPFYPQQRRTGQALAGGAPCPSLYNPLAAPQRPCWRGPSLQHAQASLRCGTPVPPSLVSSQGSTPPRPFHSLSTLSSASCSPGLPAPLSHTAFLLTCPALLCTLCHHPRSNGNASGGSSPFQSPCETALRGGLGKGRDVGLHEALECARSPCRPSRTQRGP